MLALLWVCAAARLGQLAVQWVNLLNFGLGTHSPRKQSITSAVYDSAPKRSIVNRAVYVRPRCNLIHAMLPFRP